MSKTYSAGIVTAYGAAKRAGYQGTYEDFCRQQAGYAESAAAVEQAKNTAVSAASTATTKAGEATTAATAAQTAKTQTEAAASQALTDISTARSGAISVVQTEGATQTANATAQAQAAAQSATTASTKASEASASATTATTKATEAAASATSAANAASAAQGVLESIPEDYSDLSEDVDQLKADLEDLDSHVVERAMFNGTSSVCTVDAITLSQNGDSLEIEVFPEVTTPSSGYSFASSADKTRISIGATTRGVAFRSPDDTWLYIGNDAFASEKNHYIISIQYEDDNIKFFVDGELLNTYTGQKPITITAFGKNNYWNYWKGQVGYIKYNGVKYKSISALPGFSEIDVETLLPFGFLTAEQNKVIKESNKKITIEPTNTSVNVYIPLTNGIYGKIVVGFETDHTDANYVDYWRINDSGLYISQDGVSFTRINGSLLIGAENEMAVAFQGMGDYSGGYHGDERIDLGSNCYVKFIVDGAEYGISDLVDLGTIQCENFSYREVSEIFASYSYNANHLKVADHTKVTEFSLSGFKTTNYICMEMSNFDKESLKVITAFTGLLCISSTFANKVISDIGIEYIANHPVATTVLADDIDKYSRVAKCLNGNYSCKMDSRLLNTNISGYSEPVIKVQFYDRQQDVKYYSYLPINVDVQTGDYFATECSVDWYIAND